MLAVAILMGAAGLAIYPVPGTKSSAAEKPPPDRGKPMERLDFGVFPSKKPPILEKAATFGRIGKHRISKSP
jgi:hypothetical protein